MKAHDVRPVQGGDVALQHALDVAARPRLLSEEVETGADHPIANERVGGIPGLRRHAAKPLGKLQRLPELSIVHVTGPQPPQCAQLIVGVVKSLRQLQRGGPGGTRLARGPRCVHQRPAERGLQLQLAACVAIRACGQRRQRALDSRTTLIQQ